MIIERFDGFGIDPGLLNKEKLAIVGPGARVTDCPLDQAALGAWTSGAMLVRESYGISLEDAKRRVATYGQAMGLTGKGIDIAPARSGGYVIGPALADQIKTLSLYVYGDKNAVIGVGADLQPKYDPTYLKIKSEIEIAFFYASVEAREIALDTSGESDAFVEAYTAFVVSEAECNKVAEETRLAKQRDALAQKRELDRYASAYGDFLAALDAWTVDTRPVTGEAKSGLAAALALAAAGFFVGGPPGAGVGGVVGYLTGGSSTTGKGPGPTAPVPPTWASSALIEKVNAAVRAGTYGQTFITGGEVIVAERRF